MTFFFNLTKSIHPSFAFFEFLPFLASLTLPSSTSSTSQFPFAARSECLTLPFWMCFCVLCLLLGGASHPSYNANNVFVERKGICLPIHIRPHNMHVCKGKNRPTQSIFLFSFFSVSLLCLSSTPVFSSIIANRYKSNIFSYFFYFYFLLSIVSGFCNTSFS